jgi:hypothetical protein
MLGITMGTGLTSTVRKCEYRERSCFKAAKVCQIVPTKFRPSTYEPEIRNEIKVMKDLYHPLIVGSHEVIEEDR